MTLELKLKMSLVEWQTKQLATFIASGSGSKDLVKAAGDISLQPDTKGEPGRKLRGEAENPPGSYEKLMAGLR